MNNNIRMAMSDLEAILERLPGALTCKIPESFLSYMRENKLEGYEPSPEAIAEMRHDLLSPATTDYVALVSLAWLVDSDEERREMAKQMRVNDGPGELSDEELEQILETVRRFAANFE